MKGILSKGLSYVFALMLCLSILCFVLQRVSFDVELHKESVYRDYIYSELNIDDEQIDNALNVVVEYIKGNSNDMQITLPDGRQIFNERELTHMVDVQNLFAICDFTKFACISGCMLCFIVLFALHGFYCFKHMARGFVSAVLSMMGVVVLVGIWYFVDFSGFWTAFHEIAFTNDLWLMMPDDALIIFYTLEFFQTIVRRIVELLAVIYGVLFGVATVLWIILPREKGRKFGKKNSGH